MPNVPLTIPHIAAQLRRFWFFPLVVASAMVLLAALYLAVRTPEYEVSMIVAPASVPGQDMQKSLLGGLSSAASLLAGAGLGGGDANLERLQQLLISPVTAAKLDPNGPVFRGQYPGEWNSESGRWEAPSGFIATIRRVVSEFLGGKPWQPPNPARLAADVKNALLFAPVGKSMMMRISIRTAKPQFGILLLTTLHKTADGIIREQEKRRVTAYLNYLNRELPQVANAENHLAISDLIVEQERQLMTLSADTVTFASEVVEPPTVPYRPIGLGPLALLAVAMALGLLAGFAGVIYLSERVLGLRALRSLKPTPMASPRGRLG